MRQSLFGLAVSFFFSGIVILLAGMFLAKIFKTKERAHKLGLDRKLDLDFYEVTTLYFNYPKISIPITFIFMGLIIIILAVFLFVVSLIQICL